MPTYIDVFAGAGGFSSGLERDVSKEDPWVSKGFVEIDDLASRTHARNIVAPRVGSNIMTYPETGTIPQVDVVVGSPPCPTYSSVGRSSIRGLEQELSDDPRNELWREWVRVVRAAKPKAALMENVPGFVHHLGVNMAEMVAERLSDAYHVWYTVLDAAAYGVPQHRERMILLALRKDMRLPDAAGIFPGETHVARRRVAPMRALASIVPLQHVHWRMTEPPPPGAPRARTVRDAIGGLPGGRVGVMRVPMPMDDELQAHVWRTVSERDARLFAIMEQGDTYSVMFAEAGARNLCGANLALPPYDPHKFKDKWRRLIWDEPANTLTAHLAHDVYTHIHPGEHRGITVREAARLQTFGDNFVFPVKITDAMRQIGNAVPPELARVLAKHVRGLIT